MLKNLDIVHNINSVKKMFRLVVHFNKLERIDEIFPRLIIESELNTRLLVICVLGQLYSAL